jgi:leucyl aminopeptidase (aminopeptidase T)
MTSRRSRTSSSARCLLDWDAERDRMQRYADRFDARRDGADRRRGTDLTSRSRAARDAVDDAHYNMPGGEFFYSPLEDSRRA